MEKPLREFLEKKTEDLKTELQKIKNLETMTVTTFPNLKRHVDRWRAERFCSIEANKRVTNCTIKHNCGCCPDSPLEVWPYLVFTDGIFIYSDPPSFMVGEKNGYGYGDIPYNNWKKKMREANIPETIIEKVKEYFEKNKPESEED
jgi:hypothetical protein